MLDMMHEVIERLGLHNTLLLHPQIHACVPVTGN